MLVCPNSPDDEPHVRTLVGAVGSGTRRRFSVLDKTSILESVRKMAMSQQVEYVCTLAV